MKNPSYLNQPVIDGISQYTMSSWTDFMSFLNDTNSIENPLYFPNYVLRGQSHSKWKIESTLDRALRSVGKTKRPEIEQLKGLHLELNIKDLI